MCVVRLLFPKLLFTLLTILTILLPTTMSSSTIPSTGHLLKRLRSLMQLSSSGPVQAYIVPSGDAHQSEYVATCDMRREFISKFSGSAGTAVITLNKAALWTDGRYFLQAAQQLDPDSWTLMKDGLPDTKPIEEWLKDELSSGSKVGVDPMLISHESWSKLSKELKSSNISLHGLKDNLVDQVWTDTSLHAPSDLPKPPRPSNKLINLDTSITGKDWTKKVSELREELKKMKTTAIVLTALDDVAWLLNLRGTDIAFNPVFFAYCIVTMDNVYLFVNDVSLTPQVRESINANKTKDPNAPHVDVLPYNQVLDFITNQLVPQEKGQIWLSNKSSEAVFACVPKSKRRVLASAVTKQKAIKNEVEVENMKNCHIRDAAALCKYLAYLEATLEAFPNGNESLWEISGADYLEKCRREQSRFMDLSFPSISASGPNGAVIHYHPEESTKRPISKRELYLIDSGAQYLDGTTDVTRTVHFGTPSAKERECFTHVLKGHIQLAQSVFPRLIKGSALDSFARQYLWSQGLDYHHGTGHGVGMFLNVHEGPTSIGTRSRPDDPGIEAGQILSNEPGYYEDGAFGIRIESLIVARKAQTKYNFNNQGYLRFETITLVPIQLKMIDISLMTDDEIEWLNEYHANCRSVVGSYLESIGEYEVKKWLVKETEKLVRQ